MRKMEKQLNETGYVCELVHYYSGGSDHVKDALDELKIEKMQTVTIKLRDCTQV